MDPKLEAPPEVLPRAKVDPKLPPQVTLHMPVVDIRSLGLGVMAVLAVLAVLKLASGFFIPLMVGLVLTYALSPVVDTLARMRVPRALSAAVLILGLLGGTGAAVYSMADDANQLIASLPETAGKLRDALRKRTGGPQTPVDAVQKAAAELQKAADDTNGPAVPTPRGVQRVVVEKAGFNLRDHLWTGTLSVANVAGQAVVVTFLTYFLLLSGDTFRRKVVKIAGPGLAEKRLVVQALDEINAQMQRYLLVQLLASVGVGLSTGIAFALIGVNHAGVWGVVAGVLNLVPYVGSIVVTIAAMLVAFVQFGELNPALGVGAVSLLINTIEGYLLVPWATSRASRMNAVVVFVGVLAWGWLWGVWGLLLGIPILMAVKAVCDRVDHLKPIGELLGD